MKTIQDIIDLVLTGLKEAETKDTVDNLKTGDPLVEALGIVTTFTATIDVIRRASELGANLIITHEPTFYDHKDERNWLETNEVYRKKIKLLQDNNIAVLRFHDYWHLKRPDGIYEGVLKELDWNKYADANNHLIYNIPQITLAGLSRYLKDKLRMKSIRVVGRPNMECSRIGMFLGTFPGSDQIKFINDQNVDVLICGETVEWQTCEYVRDGSLLNLNKGLIVLGHANSEEAGMKYFAEWLSEKLTDIPITYIPAGDPYIYF